MARKAYILGSPAVLELGQITRGGLPHQYSAPTFTGRTATGQVSLRPVYAPQTDARMPSEGFRPRPITLRRSCSGPGCSLPRRPSLPPKA
jgi:hypothetical protein